MALIKCKICGGDMNISDDKTFGTCEYCGCTMTLPKVNDEQKAAAFNRGNHFRMSGEFDKALQVYEHIIAEDDTDAEAHWCAALCRFGIEWVEDPATLEYLPTCHRASFDLFTNDVDYLAALEHSDGLTKRQYQKDAAKITEVQRGILATSQNEKPFDVFICYKESDENGRRTIDSTLAQDIYYQLTDQGLRVFFARITLEDKAGSEYEPYIFAALNSAKAMVAVGTKPEYFNAVWVKNEWSRYLSLVKRNRNKVLLPCYRDMDPYDLPEQLSVLQSYDMTKIGFIQDLIRGIKKITATETKQSAQDERVAVVNSAQVSADPLLKRAYMFLEDGEWQRADEFFEQVLNIDPESVKAYFGKMMAELHVTKQSELVDLAEPFDENYNYKKVLRFADEELKNQLLRDNETIRERNEYNRKSAIRSEAAQLMEIEPPTISNYAKVIELLASIEGFEDADEVKAQCESSKEKMERELEQETVYQKAESVRVTDAYKAYELYSSIPEWKDASEKAEKCKGLIDKVDQIAATIWHNRGNRVTQDLLENFEEWKQEENRISEDIRAKSVEINGLAQTISKLSAFHAKEKRNCQEKLSSLQAQLEDLSTKQRIVKGSLQGFSSLNQVKAALQKEKETSDTLTGMGVDLNGWLTNEDAMKLLKDGAVKSQLKKRYPMLNDCDTLLPVMEFGCYPQNADGEVAPIKWLVLNEEMGKKLLVSKYALDTERFGFSEWTKSRVRTWLNDSFRSQAFTAGEQAQIVTPNENQGSVFLLSEEETREYLVSYRCKPTLYAMRKGVTADAEGFCEWWLRTPGSSSGSEMAVSGDAIMTMGFFTLRDCVGIRPAILIKAN